MRLDPLFQKTTRQKYTLRVALLISAVIHGAAFVWVKLEHRDNVAAVDVTTLEVTLIDAAPVNEPEVADQSALPMDDAMPAPAAKMINQEPGEQPDGEVAASVENLGDIDPALQPPTEPVDLQALISSYAEDAAMQNLERERHRDKMWRKTFSVMFAPPEDWIIEDEPYLPDLQFEADKPKRLGIKISENCYLGLPGIDPQTVDSDGPGWSGGGAPQPTVNLISCGFGK